MFRRISVTFIVVLIFCIQLAVRSSDDVSFNIKVDDDSHSNEDDTLSSSTTSITIPTTTTTTTTPTHIEPIEENAIDNVSEQHETTSTSTTIIDEKQAKQFLTEYLLNVNLSSSSLSDITFNAYLNDTILLVLEEHKIFLINKTDGSIKNHFEYANIIPINQQTNRPNLIIVFDDNTRDLWILNSTYQHKTPISFIPKRIYVLPSKDNVWFAETVDELALFVSEDSGASWRKLDETASSTILGWSSKTNSIVISQHSKNVKLLNAITYQTNSVLNDVSSAKLFSRYLLAKKSNANNSIAIGHINNFHDGNFRSLPKRLQSQGNFYCAIEDIYTQDLLLLFITDDRLGENNETILSTCNLISYSKQQSLNLSNIHCQSINKNNQLNIVDCSTSEIPFYQVHGLSRSIYIVNVEPGPSTLITFDGGLTWNKTHYDCDKAINCPNNASILISSLTSSNEAPGIVVGKASDGVNEYVAISSNGGRSWKLSATSNNYLTALSNPNALIVSVSNNSQSLSHHSLRYTTDYGRNWNEYKFSNDSSYQILSLTADVNNTFYLLTLNNENKINLIELDFNQHITESCARYQIKEWALHNGCINGSKLFYKRRSPDSNCLGDVSQVRSESCVCSLADFECLPGYKRSKDGICLPKSYYIFSHECSCSANSSLLTKRRGYVKSVNSQCTNGIESYLSDAFVTHRDPNHANFFFYGVDSRTKQPIVEIHNNDFNQFGDDDDDDDDDDEDDDDENEDLLKNTVWSIDNSYEITALVFNESGKQVYFAVKHDISTTVYRIGKNLRQQNRQAEKLTFDSDNELYRTDEHIKYLAVDWSTDNLYVLSENTNTLEQTVFILDVRTHKRRTIVKNHRIQPAILIIDPMKTELYWISQNSPSIFVIANLQGEIKRQFPLPVTNTNISYISYDPITHEIIYVIDSNIYGLNTLERYRLSSRLIYQHSSTIENPLFVHPVLYFTNGNDHNDSSIIHLHSIDVLAKSFAKNIAKFRNFDSIQLLIDMSPSMPISSTMPLNPCANSPCSDICIPLEHGRFRCICNDEARYQTCSCPTDERFSTGGCQAKNGQCAPGRVLCQNRLNCAESARICEQDHTRYTESFKTTARCTIEKPDDGFDCYYTDDGIPNVNKTCIPYEWLCDGIYDCPLGNDEEHCYKLTTTRKPATQIVQRCLTEKRFTHIMCGNRCMQISNVCENITNENVCSEPFHLHCKQTNDKDQYDCKCKDNREQCIAMIEPCDDLESCEKICRDSIHYANSKSGIFGDASSTPWIILAIGILILLILAIVVITVRYMRQRKNTQKSATSTRTPPTETSNKSKSTTNDASEKLLNNASSPTNETS